MASSVHHAPSYSRISLHHNIRLSCGVLVSPIRNQGKYVLSPVRQVPVVA